MLIPEYTPPLTTAVQDQERLQRAWDYWREELRAGFDTSDLEEDGNHDEQY